MDIIVSLLHSLGVNKSLYIQLGVFLIVFIALKYLLFKPYFAAYLERGNRTVGKTELAEKFLEQTAALEAQYSQKAQAVNEQFRAVFDQSRGEANKQYEALVGEARAQAKQVVETTRESIKREVDNARKQLSQEVKGVSQLINQKLIGKDLST
jgi:F-type H+-transporting ATPase subunit b